MRGSSGGRGAGRAVRKRSTGRGRWKEGGRKKKLQQLVTIFNYFIVSFIFFSDKPNVKGHTTSPLYSCTVLSSRSPAFLSGSVVFNMQHVDG